MTGDLNGWRCPSCNWDNPAVALSCGDCGQDLVDICLPGMPDPTPDGTPEEWLCRATSPAGGAFLCTRLRDHKGRQHVAGSRSGLVVAVWGWLQ